MAKNFISLFLLVIFINCKNNSEKNPASIIEPPTLFKVVQTNDHIEVFLAGHEKPVVTQNIKPNFRPFIHPILAPSGLAELTQYSPAHHPHQTGLFWGFTRVNGTGADIEEVKAHFYDKDKPEHVKKKNGRDFFHNPGADYWQKVSAQILIGEGSEVKWQSVYNMLDEHNKPILQETQIWTLQKKWQKPIGFKLGRGGTGGVKNK